MMEGMRYKCINHSHILKGCQLLTTNGLLIDKKDLIPNCDGYKMPSECCWFKDMDLVHYV